jgi:hypothetical protein
MLKTPRRAGSRHGTTSIVLFGILFAIFIVNILLGKAEVAFGWKVPFLFSDVGEYLVLLFAALLFTVASLIREGIATGTSNSQQNVSPKEE